MVAWLLAGLIVLQGIALVRDLREYPRSVPVPIDNGRPERRSQFDAAALAQIERAHLFGEAVSGSTASVALAPSAFKLLGLYVPDSGSAVGDPSNESAATQAERDERRAALEAARGFFGDRTLVTATSGAIAWLSIAGAPPQRVQVGEAVGGGAVRGIGADGVTLQLDGRVVRVGFPENPFVAMLRGESTTVIVSADPNVIPAELLSAMLRFQPQQGPGGLTGFRLYPGSDEQGFAKTGLQAGDVLEAIEGRPITMARDIVPLLQALRETKPIPLRLIRAARPIDLQLFRPARAGTSAPRRASVDSVTRPSASAVPRISSARLDAAPSPGVSSR
jgi:hypothetical protein